MPRKKRTTKSDPERVKRPTLPRTEPIRSWSTLVGGGQPGGANGSRGPVPTGRDAGDAVQRGVEIGYRVVDEYVRQGAAVASAFANPGRTGLPTGDDLPRMTERMMQYASDFSSLWFDAMGVMLGSANGVRAPAAPSPAAPPAAGAGVRQPPPASAATTGRARYELDIKSEHQAEIIVALDESATAAIEVEPLQARGKGKRIADVAISLPEPGGPLRIRVHVPAGFAPGRYTGAVLDAATRLPKGRLTVVLRAE